MRNQIPYFPVIISFIAESCQIDVPPAASRVQTPVLFSTKHHFPTTINIPSLAHCDRAESEERLLWVSVLILASACATAASQSVKYK